MKIYFAGSIRGGRDDFELYSKLIEHLKTHGEVLSEHIGDKNLTKLGESISEQQIHDRDLEWLLSCNVVVAEVSTPSLGIGYEIGRGVENDKNILCLYRSQEGKKLSAMIAGCKRLDVVEYKD